MKKKRRDDADIALCALVPYPPNTTPSQRFRIEQWIPSLTSRGMTVDLLPFADRGLMTLMREPGMGVRKAASAARAFFRRTLDVARASSYDAVLIHRAACIAGPALLERALSLIAKPVIFDFDDAIFELHTDEPNRRLGWLKFPGKTAAICRLSSDVVAGNNYLADYARQYNERVWVIPTSVDTDRYRPEHNSGSNGTVVVGWTGSSTSQTYLEMAAPMLRELVARRPVELRVISDREPNLPGVPHTWTRWSLDTEVKELARFDVGIMPMPDDTWARGKCSLKALLYMAMGIPAVCSAVGTNREVIRSGENGLLASDDREFLTHLERLVDDAALRKRLGAAGRRTIVEHYSMYRCADSFARVIRQAVTPAGEPGLNRQSCVQ